MNKLKITLNEDGSVIQFTPDFKIMRGSYRNVLINIEVPHSLLIDPVVDADNNSNLTGNNVRIGAIIRTVTGQNLQTQRYEFQRVKDYIYNGIGYRLYQRKMPKEFTMWETVNQLEATNSGVLEMVINVTNWTISGNNAKIEEVAASPVFTLDIYPSAFLENAEEIDEPSDFDELYSQVQNIDKQVDNMDEDLYGTDANTLGTYLLTRLKAGNKITIEQDSTQAPNNKLKISVQTINANEVPISPITDVYANDVQGALEQISARTDSQVVKTVNGEDTSMVDNSDPLNPIIKHDNSKVDKSVMQGSETPNGVVASVGGDHFTSVDVDSMSLHVKVRSVADGSLLSDTAIPLKLASAISRGLMPKESVATLSNLVSRVASLEGKTSRFLYTDKTNPTASEIDAFAQAQGQVSPYDGVAIVVDETYHIWHYYENDNIGWKDDGSDTVNKASNDALGIVIGSTEDGKIYVESDGSMSLVGFDTITSAITSLENSKLDNVVIESGTNNGTIKITKTINGNFVSTDNIQVKGLGSAAYTNSSDYIPSSSLQNLEKTINKASTINADNKTSTTLYPNNKAVADYVDTTLGYVEDLLREV